MSVKNQVFLQLYNAKGEAVSGEELAKNLRVTRAAVWKAVKTLREEGYKIDSSTNRGYSLSACDMGDLAISGALNGLNVVHLDSVNSTNAYAQSLQTDCPALIIADRQTQGKARHHGSFSSPAGAGIYMSYLFFPKIELNEVGNLTKKAVSAVAEVTNGVAVEQAILKDGEKIGGVLVEVTADQDGVEKAVIGMGIYTNCSATEKQQMIIDIMRRLINE